MMKLKGEMVIELTDTNTGAVETVQETNMITEASRTNIRGAESQWGIYLKASGSMTILFCGTDAASHLPEHDRGDPAVSGSAGRKGGSYLRAGEEPAGGLCFQQC